MRVKANEYHEEQGTVLDEDRYAAILTGFGETEGQYGPRLVWQFEVTNEETGELVEAAAFTSYSMADGKKVSNLIKFSKALRGEIPEDGFDLDELLGKPCQVDIETYTKDNGITKNKVVMVKPPKRGQKGKKIEKPTQNTSSPQSEEDDQGKASGDIEFDESDFDQIPF